MPLYTYECVVHGPFEISSSIATYKSKVKCIVCKKMCERNIMADASSLVHAGDSSPKTLGHMADLSGDKLSTDEKTALYKKHNAYKEGPERELPKGMERIEKPKEREYWT